MLDWDSQFMVRSREAARQITVQTQTGQLCAIYKRYVDDLLNARKAVPPGARWVSSSSSVIFSQKAMDEDKGKPQDEIMMNFLQSIVNTINPRIQFTVDFSSANQNGKMPCLDFQSCVGE